MVIRKRGFTLIELLVVVAIIALLISILLPSLNRARQQAKKVVCASNLRSLAQAMVTYANENRDELPAHQGPEPKYVYIAFAPAAPANQWHLGELLLPMMNMAPLKRGSDGRFDVEELRRFKETGEIFYCPSSGNLTREGNDPPFGEPNDIGMFMDYAQVMGFMGPASIRLGNRLQAISPDGVFKVLDDEQQPIEPPTGSLSGGSLWDIPHSVSDVRYRKVPGSNAEVPVMMDLVVSVGRTDSQYQSQYDQGQGDLQPKIGNHPRYTEVNENSGVDMSGGNYAYIDGHVEWRQADAVAPRLLIDRQFTGGSNRPTYWW